MRHLLAIALLVALPSCDLFQTLDAPIPPEVAAKIEERVGELNDETRAEWIKEAEAALRTDINDVYVALDDVKRMVVAPPANGSVDDALNAMAEEATSNPTPIGIPGLLLAGVLAFVAGIQKRTAWKEAKNGK